MSSIVPVPRVIVYLLLSNVSAAYTLSQPSGGNCAASESACYPNEKVLVRAYYEKDQGHDQI
jgi:hypothetical protein